LVIGVTRRIAGTGLLAAGWLESAGLEELKPGWFWWLYAGVGVPASLRTRIFPPGRVFSGSVMGGGSRRDEKQRQIPRLRSG
jgi:hypothetical protein